MEMTNIEKKVIISRNQKIMEQLKQYYDSYLATNSESVKLGLSEKIRELLNEKKELDEYVRKKCK